MMQSFGQSKLESHCQSLLKLSLEASRLYALIHELLPQAKSLLKTLDLCAFEVLNHVLKLARLHLSIHLL